MGFPIIKRCKEILNMCVDDKIEHVCMTTYLDMMWSHDQEPQWVFLSLRGAKRV